jgi:carbamoylphosphate synthase large subunit
MFKRIMLTALIYSSLNIAIASENVDAIVERGLESILIENDFNARVARSQELTRMVTSLNEAALSKISCNTIEKLNQAIVTERPAVRAQLAQVVGAIGPRASGSLPALRKALAEELSPSDIGPFDPLPAWDDSKIYQSAIERIEDPHSGITDCKKK